MAGWWQSFHLFPSLTSKVSPTATFWVKITLTVPSSSSTFSVQCQSDRTSRRCSVSLLPGLPPSKQGASLAHHLKQENSPKAQLTAFIEGLTSAQDCLWEVTRWDPAPGFTGPKPAYAVFAAVLETSSIWSILPAVFCLSNQESSQKMT